MDICKKNVKYDEQIKQEYEQAVDPGLVDFIENVHSAYKTSNGKPAPILLYVKKINGFYVVAEAVNDSSKKRLNVISAYKSKANPLKNN
jgi:hypothetical protein